MRTANCELFGHGADSYMLKSADIELIELAIKMVSCCWLFLLILQHREVPPSIKRLLPPSQLKQVLIFLGTV
ncbi:hypothetical protein LC609_30440 [Nostoc sp. XA013]|nr:hypothetical protein [Nostoc sp. XA013]